MNRSPVAQGFRGDLAPRQNCSDWLDKRFLV
nr:MAG TPA: hypothetical protein [Caudoviricetes sp.]